MSDSRERFALSEVHELLSDIEDALLSQGRKAVGDPLRQQRIVAAFGGIQIVSREVKLENAIAFLGAIIATAVASEGGRTALPEKAQAVWEKHQVGSAKGAQRRRDQAAKERATEKARLEAAVAQVRLKNPNLKTKRSLAQRVARGLKKKPETIRKQLRRLGIA